MKKIIYKLEKIRSAYYEGISSHVYCISSSIKELKKFVSESDTKEGSHQWEKNEEYYTLTTEVSYFEDSNEIYEEIYWMISPIKVV